MSLRAELTQGLLHLLYPAACAVCAQPLPGSDLFCQACRDGLSADPHRTCPRCAATVGTHVPLDDGCFHCRDESLAFEQAIRLGPYDGLLRDVILRLKYQEGMAEMMGRLWAEHAEQSLRALSADMVVPVPLHWWRRWTRGFNQSEILASHVAERLGIGFEPFCLRRIRSTPPQTLQPPSGRRENVRDAFQARPRARVQGRTVLLVDDVLTTGSTCSQAARVLRAAGAARVVVAVLAKSQG